METQNLPPVPLPQELDPNLRLPLLHQPQPNPLLHLLSPQVNLRYPQASRHLPPPSLQASPAAKASLPATGLAILPVTLHMSCLPLPHQLLHSPIQLQLSSRATLQWLLSSRPLPPNLHHLPCQATLHLPFTTLHHATIPTTLTPTPPTTEARGTGTQATGTPTEDTDHGAHHLTEGRLTAGIRQGGVGEAGQGADTELVM